MTSHKQIGKRLLGYLRPHRGKLALGLVCGVLAGLVPAGVAAMIEEFASVTISARNGDVEPLAWVCGTVVLLYTALWVFSYGQSVLLAEVAQRVGMRMRGDVYAHLQSLSLSYFHKHRTGALMSTLTNDVPKLQNAAMMVRDVVATPLMAVVFLVLLFVTSWKLALFALLVVPLMAVAIQLLSLPPARHLAPVAAEDGRHHRRDGGDAGRGARRQGVRRGAARDRAVQPGKTRRRSTSRCAACGAARACAPPST